MTIYQVLQTTGLPVEYYHFNKAKTPPYLVYIGTGQTNFEADDAYYYGYNRYQVEYYYTLKDENAEAAIESALLANGFRYAKSEDNYIEAEGVFVIYYYL